MSVKNLKTKGKLLKLVWSIVNQADMYSCVQV